MQTTISSPESKSYYVLKVRDGFLLRKTLASQDLAFTPKRSSRRTQQMAPDTSTT